jgi:hypothetical protein
MLCSNIVNVGVMAMIRINRSIIKYSAIVSAGLMVMASPAEARRGFAIIPIGGWGGGSGESITLVHDLPNEEPYVKEGKYFDVGYLNSDGRAGFVIYSGDRFTKIDDEQIAALATMLGFDPTAQYKADHAEEWAEAARKAEQERAHKADRIASGKLIEREEGESDEAFQQRKDAFLAEHRSSSAAHSESSTADQSHDVAKPSKTGMGGMLAVIVLLAVGWFNRKSLFGRGKTVAAGPNEAFDDFAPDSALDTGSFDERVARRLAQLNGGAVTDERATPAPQVRSFGRKSA